jgi:hypothetical protein
VQVRYHDMTYNLWVYEGSIVIMVGCHVVRVTPDEAEMFALVLRDLVDQARS